MGDKQSSISAAQLFSSGTGITYADYTLIDTNYSEMKEPAFETRLGDITLQTPIIGAPMDTVMSAEACIALAQEGGIGALHYNHKTRDGRVDIDAQIAEIKQVKRFMNGFVEEPVTVEPDMTIQEAIAAGREHQLGKHSIDTFPVVDAGGKLVGLLRKSDYRKTEHLDVKVQQRMVPYEKLVTATWPVTIEEAKQTLWDEHVRYLPVLDDQGALKYLVTQSDIEKNEEYPRATTDENGRLRVLFAVETRPERYEERLKKAFAAGADGVIVDTSQGYTKYVKQTIEYIKEHHPDKPLIAGNVATAEGARFLADLGVDAVRCGQGSGSICTTAGAIGVARAGAKGVYDVAHELRSTGVATIADGGLREVGDIVKALSVGADCVMLGNMLAGTEEGPGEIISDPKTGMPVKVYRGMGSKEANVGGIRGYSRLPQGVSGKVKYRGSMHEWVPLIRDGLRSGFQALNAQDIEDLHAMLREGTLRFEQRSIGSMKESGVHDLIQ